MGEGTAALLGNAAQSRSSEEWIEEAGSGCAEETEEGEAVKQGGLLTPNSPLRFEEEYAQLIGQAETIKADLASVQEKVSDWRCLPN